MKLKKILFILPNLNGGGAERVAVNYLRQLDLKKYDITLILFDKTKDLLALIPEGVKIIDLETNSTKKSFFVLLKEFKKIKPDIVYTTHSRVSTLLMFIKPFVSKFKYIARMQSMPSLEKKYGQYGVISRYLFALGFKSADIVVAQTEAMRDDALKSFGLKKEKVKVMHNPLDKEYMKHSISNAVFHFNQDEISAIASGRIRQERGFDILFYAVEKVIQHYHNFHLYILGDDRGALDELMELRKRLKLENYITFEGFQENPYVYYSKCDLFILSSKWEGFPNTMLENYYLNTPIVATKCVPIVSELIEDGVNGYTCEVGDIKDLYEKIIICIENIKRRNIRNFEYSGSNFEELF